MGKKISDLPAQTVPLIGSELMEISVPPHNGGTSKSLELNELANFFGFKTKIVNLSRTQIQNLNTAPITLLPSITGKTYYIFECIGIVDVLGVPTPYTSNATIAIYTTNASNPIFFSQAILESRVNRTIFFEKNLISTGNEYATQFLSGESILASTFTGNPSGGDFGVRLYLLYREV